MPTVSMHAFAEGKCMHANQMHATEGGMHLWHMHFAEGKMHVQKRVQFAEGKLHTQHLQVAL